MNIIKAQPEDFDVVKSITAETITSVYPKYYPKGAVEFFLSHHSDENIKNDIASGIVYILIDEETAVGTVTINKNDIGRLFVLPEYQKKGYGKALIDFSEKIISAKYNEICLSASLPAKQIYLRRGYKESEYNILLTDNGDYLCYDYMKKKV